MTIAQQWVQLRRRFVMNYGRRLLWAMDNFLGRQSLIGDHPFFEAEQFSWVQTLEANWRTIRTELDEVMKFREHVPAFHQLSPDQQRISKGDNWKTFVIYGFGNRAERNCRLCPETARILGTIPGLQNAWFSILTPGYHILPHRGVTKALIRCHLALLVPQRAEQCWIRVDEQRRHWEEGKCMVFDDTYDHEVWNQTDQDRAVLFIDIERPLKLPGRLLAKFLVRAVQWTAYVQDARKNLATWEDRLEAAVQRAETYQYTDADEKARTLPDQAVK